MIEYLVSIFTEGAIFGIMALGLNVIWGWSGDFDLAYYGYVALGAYMTLVLTIGPPFPPTEYILGLQLPYLVALIGAMASSALMGLVVGIIALRHLRGIYFSIVTLGAVYVLYVMAGQYVPLFNGYNGLYGLFNPMGDALGLDFQSYQYFFLGFLPVHVHPRADLYGASLREPIWPRATLLREDERVSQGRMVDDDGVLACLGQQPLNRGYVDRVGLQRAAQLGMDGELSGHPRPLQGAANHCGRGSAAAMRGWSRDR